jgi:AcrR family transcriptional regulator
MPRPDVSAERKSQIIDTARMIFARKGFHQARMDDIVKESGLSKGAIYWYFKSKDAILLELISQIFDQEMEYLRSLLVDDLSASECLLRFTRHAMHNASQMTELLPLIYEFYALAAREETIHQEVHRHFLSFRELLLPLFRRGVEQSEFRPVDPEAAFITYSALFEGLVLMWTLALDRQAIDLEALAQQAVHMFLQGLATPDS